MKASKGQSIYSRCKERLDGKDINDRYARYIAFKDLHDACKQRNFDVEGNVSRHDAKPQEYIRYPVHSCSSLQYEAVRGVYLVIYLMQREHAHLNEEAYPRLQMSTDEEEE